MKYLKLYENINDLDPFDEEDWDEKESLGIIKINFKESKTRIGDGFLIVYMDNKKTYLAFLDLEFNEFNYDDSRTLNYKNIEPITDDDIKMIKDNKIGISTFYVPIDSKKISLKTYTYSELNNITNIMDEVEFIKENFEFNEEDFDEEEDNPNITGDEDLVDAMLQITLEDFGDGVLDAYYELLGYLGGKIIWDFLSHWDWRKREGLSLGDNAVELTENIIGNGRSLELKKFFREIVKKYRDYAIGFLPEELSEEFK